jgi:hypothetical protein
MAVIQSSVVIAKLIRDLLIVPGTGFHCIGCTGVSRTKDNADIAVTADIAGNWMGRVLSFQLDVWTDAYHA